MFPIVSTGLPSYAPAQAPASNATLVAIADASGNAGAAARQFTTNAVNATGAPAAYFPGTAPQREVQNARATTRVQVPPPTGDYILVDEPPAPPPPQAAPRISTPVTLGIPLTAQLTAQFMAQQPNAAAQQAEEVVLPRQEKPATENKRGEGAPFATAKGARAYGFAAARASTLIARPDVEAV